MLGKLVHSDVGRERSEDAFMWHKSCNLLHNKSIKYQTGRVVKTLERQNKMNETEIKSIKEQDTGSETQQNKYV